MSWPKIFRRIFDNEGAGPLVRADILPEASHQSRGAVPEGGLPWQVYGVGADGSYGFMNGSLSGLISAFSGSFGGTSNKYPIDRKTGLPDLSFALCDGGEYIAPDGAVVVTPDLRGRFILGAGDSYPQGSAGGSASGATGSAGAHTHTNPAVGATTLTASQMPAHRHAVYANQGGSHTHTQGATGSSGAHTHTVGSLPPYYALAFIMKL